MVLKLSTSENTVIFALVGEDKNFISKFMTMPGQTIFNPADAKEIFSKEELSAPNS